MNQASLSWRTQCIIIAIILLLHGTMLVTLFITQMQQDNERHEAIVMLDPDQFLPEQNKTELDWVAVQEALATAPAPGTEPLKQTKLDPLPPVTLDALPALSATSAQSPQTSQEQIDQAVAIAQQMLQESEETPSVTATPPSAEAEKTTEITHEAVAKETLQIAQAPGTSIEITQEKPAAIIAPKKPAQPFTPQSTAQLGKKNISLAQLTQGFVGHLEQAALTVNSKKSGAATAEQLKQLNFLKKILDCLVTSYKIQRINTPHEREMNEVRIQLAINENGSIHTLKINQSSGNPAIDKFLLDMFQDASSSFPPVPQSFNQKVYVVPTFHIPHIEAFRSAQAWSIN